MRAILPLFYFGNIAYWKRVARASELSFAVSSLIPKKSYTNRTIILSANGLQTLTIPLVGGRGSKVPYKDIRILCEDRWLDIHKMALQSAYSKSPFYEYYMPYFIEILDRQFESLVELNLVIFKEVSRILKLKIKSELSEFSNRLDQEFIPNEFDKTLASYNQVFDYKFPFQPDLSILDLLFCEGPKAREYLIS